MATPVIEAMARAMADNHILISCGHYQLAARNFIKALEENITDEMIDASSTCDPSDGVLPIFTAMLRAAREE